MEQGNVFDITEKKLEEILETDSKYNPSITLFDEYSFWLGQAVKKANECDNFVAFSVNLMNKIYETKAQKGYHWIDKVENLTVISLRIAESDNQQQEIE